MTLQFIRTGILLLAPEDRIRLAKAANLSPAELMRRAIRQESRPESIHAEGFTSEDCRICEAASVLGFSSVARAY